MQHRPNPPMPPGPVAPVLVRPAAPPLRPPPPARPDAPTRGYFRPDIEGMRGVAVLLVVLFHAWPGLVGGGFIGVDVFFVISGFLITGLLYRELAGTGRVRFSTFYVRRIRRLFPAAALALVAIFLLSAWLLSPLALPRVSADGVAAAFSVSNIRFALTSGDYFTAVATPSPFLHFWSLSVEEQFYLVWPALLFLMYRLGGGRLVAGGIVLITVGSLALALVMTETAASWAFYSLPSRAWQLAVGGLLAIVALERSRGRSLSAGLALVGWAGLGTVLVAGVAYDELLAYPGAWALLPTLGAVALIAGGDRRVGPGLLLRTPPFRFLGRISYALYLWHWPLLVMPTVAFGEALPNLALVALVGVAVAAATLSTILVEEPIRRGTALGQGRRALRLAAPPLLGLALAVVVGVGASRWVTQEAIAESARDVAAAESADGRDRPPADLKGDALLESFDGPRNRQRPEAASPRPRRTPRPESEAANGPERTPPPQTEVEAERRVKATPVTTSAPDPTPKAATGPKRTPRPARTPRPTPIVRLPSDVRPAVWQAAEDYEALKRNGCLHVESATSPKSCVFGKPGSSFTLALVGDSHASHWYPAVRRVANKRGWRLETYVKVSCPFTDILVRNLEKKKRYTECLAFNEATVRRLKASKPDLVLTTLSRWQHPVDAAYDSPTAQGDGIARMLKQIPGAKVVIADVPYPGQDVPECLAGHIKDIRPCDVASYNRASGGSPARERRAARSAGGAVLNFNDLICGGRRGRCPVVRNDMIIFRDHHHLTATFSRSLAPALDRALEKVVERQESSKKRRDQ